MQEDGKTNFDTKENHIANLHIVFILLLSLAFRYRVKSKEDQYQKFWEQGDFGYLSARTGSVDTICAQEKRVSTFVNRGWVQDREGFLWNT